MNTITYKRYVGTVEYSHEDGILWGRVLGLDDIIDYEGESISELKKDFENAINHYLEFCRNTGRKPSKPRHGKITLTLPLEIEAGLEQVIEETGKSAKALILDAVKDTYFPSGRKTLQNRQKPTRSASKGKRVQFV